MKTATGYLYLIGGEMFVNPEEKPKEYMFTASKFGGVVWNTGEYMKALEVWQANCLPVVNVINWGNGIFGLDKGIGHPHAHLVADIPLQLNGQKCEHSVKNGKSTIVKI